MHAPVDPGAGHGQGEQQEHTHHDASPGTAQSPRRENGQTPEERHGGPDVPGGETGRRRRRVQVGHIGPGPLHHERNEHEHGGLRGNGDRQEHRLPPPGHAGHPHQCDAGQQCQRDHAAGPGQ